MSTPEGALHAEHEELMAEHFEITERLSTIVDRIRAVESALAALGAPVIDAEKFVEGNHHKPRRPRKLKADSIEAYLRTWIESVSGTGTWDVTEALTGIQSLGWSTTAEDPLGTVRPLVAKLCREGLITRVQRGEYTS